MKKKYIAGLLLSMMVVGVGCTIDEPSEIVTENPGVETPVEGEVEETKDLEAESELVFIDDVSIKNGIMSFTVRNDGEGTLTYGRPYIVEIKDETGGWALTDLTDELAFTADVVVVLPGETSEESLDLNLVSDKLEKEMEYRAVVNYSLEGSDNFFQARFSFDGKLENESAAVMEIQVETSEGGEVLPEEERVPEETDGDTSPDEDVEAEPEEETLEEEDEEESNN